MKFFNLINGIYEKLTASTIFNTKRLKVSVSSGIIQECLVSSILFNIELVVLAKAISQGK